MNCQDAVIKVLGAAASQDVISMKDAEQQLKTWERNQGFHSTLLEIFLLKHLDVNIRWMSIIYLKNGVIKYWRKGGQSCLCEEEKVFIRKKILTAFDEEVIQLAVQLAVIVGKIARVDIKQWPDVIHQTLEVVKLDKTLQQHRALLTLNQILKGLASKRLIPDQLVFRDISSNIFVFLSELNKNYVTTSLESSNSTDLRNALEMCILITKILKKLIVFGGPRHYMASSTQIDYLQFCLRSVSSFLMVRSKCTDDNCREICEKLVIFLMKVLSEMQERNSLSFVPVLEDTTKLCLERILSENGCCEFMLFIIHCGNLARSIVRSYNIKTAPTDQHSQNLTRTAIEIKTRILTNGCVQELCQHLIAEYFPLTETDIEEWGSDPEGYMLEEAGESHKFLLRPCMESLFSSLFYEYKAIVNPFTVNFTKQVDSLNVDAMSETEIIKVCCVYKAVGLASYELFHDLDFDAWFETKLMGLLSLPLKPVPVLQQHILWMVGQWINVKFVKHNRVVLYQVLAKVLMDSPDLVLRLTACKVLRLAIDDFDFVEDDFTPYVNDTFVALCQLLVCVDLCDTKMMVLNSLSIMIERINRKVRREADRLLECLPELWEVSEAHNLLRGAVINVLNHLVQGLGIESMKVLHITLPIIQYSTAVDQPAHVYLLEDGLELWLTVVKNVQHLTEQLLQLYYNIPVLLERASETLPTCLSITRMYLLVDAKAFLKEFASSLSNQFSQLLPNIKPDPASNIARIIKLSLQLVPNEFLSIFQRNILGILDFILKDETYPTLMVDYLSIFAYVVMHHPSGFGEVVAMYCKTASSCSYDDVMERFLDIWLDKIDYMNIADKKVSALALCSMIPHKLKFIYDRFALILDACVNVMYDLQKTEGSQDDEKILDSLVVGVDSTSCSDEEDNADTRERVVLSHDPAYTVTLLHYVQGKLNEAKQSYGEQLFAEAMETMDSAVAKQLKSLITAV